MRTFRRMGDANIPGYNRALVAPTGFPSDPFPFLNNKWLQLSRAKVNYAVNYHPVLGPQLVSPGTNMAGLGRGVMRRQRTMRGMGAPRIYNPFARRRHVRGLGDIQPYGINADGTPVFINPADGTVYDNNGNVMSDLSQVNSTAAGQFAATQVVGSQVSSIASQLATAFPFAAGSDVSVLPSGLNVGPPNQVYATPGVGYGFQANVPQQRPPQPQQSWWTKSSLWGIPNWGLVALGGVAVATLATPPRRK